MKFTPREAAILKNAYVSFYRWCDPDTGKPWLALSLARERGARVVVYKDQDDLYFVDEQKSEQAIREHFNLLNKAFIKYLLDNNIFILDDSDSMYTRLMGVDDWLRPKYKEYFNNFVDDNTLPAEGAVMHDDSS